MEFGEFDIKDSIYALSWSRDHNHDLSEKSSKSFCLILCIKLKTIKNQKCCGGQVRLIKSKLNVIYKISQCQNPKNYWFLTRMLVNHDKLLV